MTEFDNDYFQVVLDQIGKQPRRVVGETASVIPIFLAPQIEDKTKTREYLKEYTMPFLSDAIRGAHLVNEPRLTPQEALASLSRNEFNSTEEERAITSADLGIVIFSYMPHARGLRNWIELSKGGDIYPPQDTQETIDRFAELQAELDALIRKGAFHVAKNFASKALMRTLAFFDAGRELVRIERVVESGLGN